MYGLKVKVEVGLKFEITFLRKHLGLSIFYPNLGWNNPALFRLYRWSPGLPSKACSWINIPVPKM